MPNTYTVTNAADSGAGSLRQAVVDANANAGPDDIQFDSTFFATPQQIKLATALPAITDDVTITGTDAANCTITRNTGAPNFGIFFCNIASIGNVTFEDLTVTGGAGSSGFGAGIACGDDNVTVDSCVISNNINPFGSGGGIGVSGASSGTTLTITDSTISGNSTGGGGGGIYFFTGGYLVMSGCTVSGNTANGVGGGGLYNFTNTATITNSTFANNVAANNGGAIRSNTTGATLTLQFSTISGNSASFGGGISSSYYYSYYYYTFYYATLNLDSCIVAGNSASVVGPDVDGFATSALYNLIGKTDGSNNITDPSNKTGTIATPLDPLLGPLQNNGGPTETMVPSGLSAAANNGNPSGPATDQRGVTRPLNGGNEIGSVEFDTSIPTAIGTSPNVTSGGGISQTVTVTYADDVAIDVSTLNTGDITISGPGGFTATPTFVSVDINTNGTPRVATYTFTPPGGSWDKLDNGSYTIKMAPSQVADNTAVFIPAGNIGSFKVAVPLILTVLNDNDSGAGSLRDAILQANAALGTNDIINFDPGFFSTPRTIKMSGGVMAITGELTVNGPGSGFVTVDGQAASLIFNIDPTGAGQSVSIKGMTLTNGKNTSTGGAMELNDDNVVLNDVTITNCISTRGGAIDVTGLAALTLTSCNISNNIASGNGGGVNFNTGTSPGNLVTVTNTTISGNTSTGGDGGGLYFFVGGTLNMTGSTVSGNVAKGFGGSGGQGGGVYLWGTTANILNSTLAGNTSTGNGGAISNLAGSKLTAAFTTIAFNKSSFGGGVSNYGTMNFDSCIIASNTASTGPDLRGTVATAIYNLVSNTTGSTGITDPTNKLNVPALLGGLANYGGPTQTIIFSGGSPALNNGNPTAPATDQRGQPRPGGVGNDIGSVELDPNIPLAAATAPNVTVPGGTTETVTVVFTDDVAIKVSTLGTGDITVTGPNGFSTTPTFVSVNINTNGTPRTATYSFTAPGGTWDSADYGIYSINMVANEVSDTGGTPAFVYGGAIGTFAVILPLIVTNNNDSGLGSLRNAISLANTTPGILDTILFDGAFFSTPQTISLSTGEIAVTDAVSITWPSARVTLDGGGASRIFNITADINIDNATLKNGFSTGNGGAVLVTQSTVTMSNTTLTGNSSGYFGGALSAYGGTVNLTDCTLSGNSALGGGALYDNGATMTLLRCTVSGNKSVNSGGGILLQGYAPVTIAITNSTISGNTTSLNGGGLRAYGGFAGTLNVSNTTVTNNVILGTGVGTGLSRNGGTFNIVSSIVAQNSGGSTGDLSGTTNLNVNYSLIGATDGATITGSGNITGTLATPVDALLGPLGNHGGLTETHVPGPGSPAFNAGSDPLALGTDQRGQPRVVGSAADIGSVEVDPNIPTASATSPNVTTVGGTTQTITVTFTDDVAIKVSTLGTGDITVSGPGGFTATPTFVSVDINSDGTPRVATYTFTPPGGSWDPSDDGKYTINMVANQVSDTGGVPSFVPATVIGSFNVAIPQNLIVTNTNDSGPGSLRAAMLAANNVTSDDSITFTPGLTGTISLLSALPTISDNVQIFGSGATKVTIDGNNNFQIFRIQITGTGNVSISGLTMTKGFANGSANAAQGGAIYVGDDDLTLADCILTGNVSAANGGAVYQGTFPTASPGNLTVTNSTFSNNTSTGFYQGGGAIASNSLGSITISASSFTGNQANQEGAGGAILLYNSTTTNITSSLFANNSVIGFSSLPFGGAIGAVFGSPAITIVNSTLSGNAAINGGAIGTYFSTATITIQNSTIAFNTGTTQGGGISMAGGGTLSIESTIVAKNTSPSGPDIKGNVTSTTSFIGDPTGATVSGSALNGDPLLGALANNGGPTMTHALLAGSPCINAGSNPLALTNDQRGAPFVRVFGSAADIGAYEAQAKAPTVLSVVINGGGIQRSNVTSIVITFSEAVTLAGLPASAFTLARLANPSGGPEGSQPLGNVTLSASQVGAVVTLTFLSGGVPVEIGTSSLIDGLYQLTIDATKVSGVGGQLDGDGNGSGGDNYLSATTGANRIFRLFGDGDGSGLVDGLDFGLFRAAFNTISATFSFDGVGPVDGTDFGVFRTRFNIGVP